MTASAGALHQYARIQCELLRVQCELQSMLAANQEREREGLALAYDEDAFSQLGRGIELYINELLSHMPTE